MPASYIPVKIALLACSCTSPLSSKCINAFYLTGRLQLGVPQGDILVHYPIECPEKQKAAPISTKLTPSGFWKEHLCPPRVKQCPSGELKIKSYSSPIYSISTTVCSTSTIPQVAFNDCVRWHTSEATQRTIHVCPRAPSSSPGTYFDYMLVY